MELKNSIILTDAPITAASNGVSLSGTTVKLGHAAAGSGLSDFTENRYMYLNGFALQIGGTYADNIFYVNGTNGAVSVANYLNINGIVAGRGTGNVATNTIFCYNNSLINHVNSYENSAFGRGALSNGRNAYANSAFGFEAAKWVYDGFRNSAFGNRALYQLNNGYANTALGFCASYCLIDANFNTSIGYQALESHQTGDGNVAIGHQAGDYLISGAGLITANNCIYIGKETKAFADSVSNEIVIGYNAVGKGSNTISFGNSNIKGHYFSQAPTASANYGLVSLGSGAFDGSTSGYFTGSANGTGLAMNLASGSTSDLMNLQVGGSSKFKVDNSGIATAEYLKINGTSGTALFFQNAGAGITWNNNATIKAPSPGVITIGNEGINDFGRLQFGGTTSSFPALKRSGIGLQVRLADDSLSSYILSKKLVEANTAGAGSPNIITESETGTIYTNEGSAALNYNTLPSAAAGLIFTFVVQDAGGIRITANAGDTIRYSTSVSAVAGYIESYTLGDTVILVAINSTEWIALSAMNTWTVV